MRAYITMRSKGYIPDPVNYSIGGFTATTSDGRDISFDWDEAETILKRDIDGTLLFDTQMKCFSEDFEETNKNNGIDQELTAKFLCSLQLVEVYYEVELADDPEYIVKLNLESFEIVDENGEYAFSQECIDAYNQQQEEPVEVFVLFSCDIWKMTSTFRLQGVFSSFNTLKSAVVQLVQDNIFQCDDSEFLSDCTDYSAINNTVNYCYIEPRKVNVLEI